MISPSIKLLAQGIIFKPSQWWENNTVYRLGCRRYFVVVGKSVDQERWRLVSRLPSIFSSYWSPCLMGYLPSPNLESARMKSERCSGGVYEATKQSNYKDSWHPCRKFGVPLTSPPHCAIWQVMLEPITITLWSLIQYTWTFLPALWWGGEGAFFT